MLGVSDSGGNCETLLPLETFLNETLETLKFKPRSLFPIKLCCYQERPFPRRHTFYPLSGAWKIALKKRNLKIQFAVILSQFCSLFSLLSILCSLLLALQIGLMHSVTICINLQQWTFVHIDCKCETKRKGFPFSPGVMLLLERKNFRNFFSKTVSVICFWCQPKFFIRQLVCLTVIRAISALWQLKIDRHKVSQLFYIFVVIAGRGENVSETANASHF